MFCPAVWGDRAEMNTRQLLAESELGQSFQGSIIFGRRHQRHVRFQEPVSSLRCLKKEYGIALKFVIVFSRTAFSLRPFLF